MSDNWYIDAERVKFTRLYAKGLMLIPPNILGHALLWARPYISGQRKYLRSISIDTRFYRNDTLDDENYVYRVATHCL
jgi:hypothetical protein